MALTIWKFINPHENMTLSSITIVSWNVKGLCSPAKRMKILRHLKRLRADVALLQETHLGEWDFNRMKKLWVGKVIGTPAVGRKAGAIILLHKNLDYKLIKQRGDEEGRKPTIDILLGTRNLAISNIYAPNVQNPQLYQELTHWLAAVSTPFHLIGGDFNNVMDTREDRKYPPPITLAGRGMKTNKVVTSRRFCTACAQHWAYMTSRSSTTP